MITMSKVRFLGNSTVVDNQLDLQNHVIQEEVKVMHNRPNHVSTVIVDRKTGERARVVMSQPYYEKCIAEQQTL